MGLSFDRRENNIQALRLALSVLVLYSHSYALGGTGAVEPFARLDRMQESGGGIAVDLFFVLSGFLISASYEHSRSVWDYLLRRVRRIYPAFIVAMLISALYLLPLSGGHRTEPTRAAQCFDFITQTLQLYEYPYTGVFPHNPVHLVLNGSIWSIHYEFLCYLGLLLLGLTGLLRSRSFLLFLFLAAGVLGTLFTFPAVLALFARHFWDAWIVLLQRTVGFLPLWAHVLPMYLAGILFYRLRARLTVGPWWIAAAGCVLIAACRIPHAWHLLFPLAGGYLFLVLALHPRIHLHGLDRFGDLSYGTYLYAFPIQQLIVQHLGHPVGPLLLFSLSLPPTLLCAFCSWHLFEQWFLRPQRRSWTVSADASSLALN
jgi:peptidoglycan/LPS O-acetylase OafA/YrhL